jgi:hypothetical protein
MFSKRRIAQLSFFFLRRSFSVVAGIVDPGRRDQRSRLQPNEVDRTNILAPGFASFPPSPLSVAAPNAFGAPKSRRRHACHYSDWPNGKSYPVTAAQLLPILTGFLAPIHFSKLAKN